MFKLTHNKKRRVVVKWKKKKYPLYCPTKGMTTDEIKFHRTIDIIRTREAIRHKEVPPSWEKRRKYNWRNYLNIDGVEMWVESYASKNLIKTIKPSTYLNYRKRGLIPAPIYQREVGGYTKRYLSKRQIALINRLWSDSHPYGLEDRIAYLHANWVDGELGFGDDGDNND